MKGGRLKVKGERGKLRKLVVRNERLRIKTEVQAHAVWLTVIGKLI